MNSFRRKDGGASGRDGGGGRDYDGQNRCNETHALRTDPEAKLLRRAKGKASSARGVWHL